MEHEIVNMPRTLALLENTQIHRFCEYFIYIFLAKCCFSDVFVLAACLKLLLATSWSSVQIYD